MSVGISIYYGGPDTGTAIQTHIMAAQTRAQPSRRKHNGPYRSAEVRNTLLKGSIHLLESLTTTQQPKQLIQPRLSLDKNTQH